MYMYSLSTNNRRQKCIIRPVYIIHYFYFFLNFRMERMDEVTKRPSDEIWKYCRIFVRSPFVFHDRSSILERFRRTVMTTTEPLQSKLTLGGMWAQIFVMKPTMIETTYFLSYLKRRWNICQIERRSHLLTRLTKYWFWGRREIGYCFERTRWYSPIA